MTAVSTDLTEYLPPSKAKERKFVSFDVDTHTDLVEIASQFQLTNANTIRALIAFYKDHS